MGYYIMSIANLQSWEFPVLNVTNLNVKNNLTVDGTSALHNTTIDGTLGVTGNIGGGGNLNIAGDITGDGILDIAGNATIGGSLGVTGQITGGSLQINTNANIDGNVTVGGTIDVTGDLTANDIDVDDITASGSVSVTGGVSIGGILSMPMGSEIRFPPDPLDPDSPLVITKSHNFISFNTGFTGARNIPNNAASVTIFKFGSFVYMSALGLEVNAYAGSTAAILFSDALPESFRPTVNRLGDCTIVDGTAAYKTGRVVVQTNGFVSFGNLDTGLFSNEQLANLRTINFGYFI